MRKLLWIACFFALSIAPLSAQCWNSAVGEPPPYMSFSPYFWAPGQTYNVTATVQYPPGTGGEFISENLPPSIQPVYIVAAADMTPATWTTEDPNVAISNTAYVSPTQVSFTVTIAPGASVDTEGALFTCGGTSLLDRQ